MKMSNNKIGFGDLILSVLPWPFHKDLPNLSPSSENCAYKPCRIDVIRNLLSCIFHYELLACPNGDKRKIGFVDLVLSVLPWPFHKDLPSGCSDE